MTEDSAPEYRRVLTPDLVATARRRVAAGELVSAVAVDIGIKHTTLCAAVTGRSWSAVDSVVPPVRRNLPTDREHYTDEQRAAIVDRALTIQSQHPTLTIAAIARLLDLQPSTLRVWTSRHRRAQG